MFVLTIIDEESHNGAGFPLIGVELTSIATVSCSTIQRALDILFTRIPELMEFKEQNNLHEHNQLMEFIDAHVYMNNEYCSFKLHESDKFEYHITKVHEVINAAPVTIRDIVANPELIGDLDKDSLTGYQISVILEHHPELVEHLDISKIQNPAEWAFLLVKRPELLDYCSFEHFTETYWKILESKHPELIQKKREELSK